MLSDCALQGTTYLTSLVSAKMSSSSECFAESVYLCDNPSGNLHSWSSGENKCPVLPSCTQSPGSRAGPQPRGLAGALGWGGLWCIRVPAHPHPHRGEMSSARHCQSMFQHPTLDFLVLLLISISYSPGDTHYWNYI